MIFRSATPFADFDKATVIFGEPFFVAAISFIAIKWNSKKNVVREISQSGVGWGGGCRWCMEKTRMKKGKSLKPFQIFIDYQQWFLWVSFRSFVRSFSFSIICAPLSAFAFFLSSEYICDKTLISSINTSKILIIYKQKCAPFFLPSFLSEDARGGDGTNQNKKKRETKTSANSIRSVWTERKH